MPIYVKCTYGVVLWGPVQYMAYHGVKKSILAIKVLQAFHVCSKCIAKSTKSAIISISPHILHQYLLDYYVLQPHSHLYNPSSFQHLDSVKRSLQQQLSQHQQSHILYYLQLYHQLSQHKTAVAVLYVLCLPSENIKYGSFFSIVHTFIFCSTR